MGREIIFLAVMVLGMVATASTAKACSRTNTFGNNCEYQCHCAGDRGCGDDGSCPNRCASGWKGEYCQRGNAATEKSSTQSTTDGSYSSSLAVDGYTSQTFSTCSHTTSQYQPWWQVDLRKEYVLFTVKIWNSIDGDVRECKTTRKGTEYRGTLSTTRKGFKCDEWLDPNPTFHRHQRPANSYKYCRNPNGSTEPWCYTTETNENNRWDYCDVSWCQSKLKNFKIWMDNTLCHHYKGTVGFGHVVDIRCDTPVVGRHLEIQLLDSSTVLTLCEVTIRASQYRACSNKHYGPNCNNRCQCANDAKCHDKTGLCPSRCNDRFSGPYCNIGIPSVSKNGAPTPTSISVKWQSIIHDSAYDAGKVVQIALNYKENKSPSSSRYAVSYPSPGMMSANVTNLKPSTEYCFRIQLTFKKFKTGSVWSPLGPTAHFQTESCTDYMVIPVITVTRNAIYTILTWPNRAYLEIKAEVPGMMAGCNKELDVYVKKTNESYYVHVKITKARQTYTIYRLTAFTEYDIKATVTSPDGYKKDTIQKTRTAEDVPSTPSIAKVGASPYSVSIRITPPDPPYGIITKYDLEMREAGSSGRTYSYGPANLTHTFDELKLITTYNFKARASTSYGSGAWTSVIQIATVEDIPGPPNTLIAQEHTTTSMALFWTKPIHPNGILKNYKVICIPLFSYDDEVNRDRTKYTKQSNPGPDEKVLTVTGLTPATEYNCSIAAHTSKGYGPSIWLINWTKPEVPGPPNTLIAQEHTTTSMALLWTKPIHPNGILKNYKVICKPLFSYDDKVDRDRTKYTKQSSPGPDEQLLTVSGLTPATEYNCSVLAQTSKGYGPSIWLRNWTKPEEAVVPDDLFLRITARKTTDSTITVAVPNLPKSLKTGSISKVRIAVERQETRRKRSTPLLEEDHDNLTDHATAKEKGYPGYIAAELGANFSGPFVIGDGKMYGGYDNPPLTKGQKYDVIFGMVLALGEVTTVVYRRYGQPITVEAARSLNEVGLGVGLTGGVLVVLGVVIVVMIIRRKRREKRETAESIDTQLHSITGPTTMPEVEQVEREVSDNKTGDDDAHNHGEPFYVNRPNLPPEQEVLYDETIMPAPNAAVPAVAKKKIQDLSVEDFKQWLLSKHVTESTYQILAKNELHKAVVFALLEREDIKALRIKAIGQEILVRNLVESFRSGAETKLGDWRMPRSRDVEEGAYMEIENPYEELNITPDVIAGQVYAKIKPWAFSRADC